MYLVAGVVRMFRAWRKYNESLRELNRLDDRELADIGITRCDIQRIAWEAARADTSPANIREEQLSLSCPPGRLPAHKSA